MRRTGKRSNTSRSAGTAVIATAVLGLFLPGIMVSWAPPCRALDVFTLWNRPELPLMLDEGVWADYRTQVMAGGRREENTLRVACTGRDGDGAWIIELLPMDEVEPSVLVHREGEGVRLVLDAERVARRDDLLEAVRQVTRWRGGVPEKISPAQLREDPLVAASLDAAFEPDVVEPKKDATRIVRERELMCRQFVMTSTATDSVDLPAGTMVQTTTREVTAAVHGDVPFLGVAYAAERVRAESRLDPPSERFDPPAPRVRVEVMELVDFGDGATPSLPEGD